MNAERPSTDDIVIRPVPASGATVIGDDDRSGTGADVPPAGRHGDDPAHAVVAGGPAATRTGGRGGESPLLDDEQAEVFRRRWSDVQARFVDDPRAAVLDGDALVADLVHALAQRFAQHRDGLEDQWSRGAEPSTEELRLALQQYRSFFQRLLAT